MLSAWIEAGVERAGVVDVVGGEWTDVWDFPVLRVLPQDPNLSLAGLG